MHQARAVQMSEPTGCWAKMARIEVTIAVTGWFSANHGFDLSEVIDHGDQVRIDIGPWRSGHLTHPPRAVGSADPQRAVDAQCLRPQRPPVQQHVLAGVSSEAFPEEHDARPAAASLS